MDDTTSTVSSEKRVATGTCAARRQHPGDEEAVGWDIGTGSAGWNPRGADGAATDLPVVTQPGLGVTTTTVTTITQTGGDWSSGLFDVFGDRTTCLLGAFVPCCLDLALAHQYGECLCLPLLPGSTLAMRVGIRERYKIRVRMTTLQPGQLVGVIRMYQRPADVVWNQHSVRSEQLGVNVGFSVCYFFQGNPVIFCGMPLTVGL
uniref:PLAC8 like 1 n=1 Tax=Esox lucius TaxID=8010 RepID=A0AAY5K2L2_ESOLU